MSLEKLPTISFPEREKGSEKIESIKEYLKKKGESLQKIGVPIGEDFRVKPDFFSEKVFSKKEIDYDNSLVEERKKEQRRNKEFLSEAAEFYWVALLNKLLGDEVLAVRASEYDDRFNHVDTLVIDKKTGQVICTIDEVLARQEETISKKRERINTLNSKGGTKIKYGIRTKKEGDRIFIEPYSLFRVPVFYFPLSEKDVLDGISNFDPKENKISEQDENTLFAFFNEVERQLDEFKENPALKERAPQIRHVIKRLKDFYLRKKDLIFKD